MLCQFPEFPNQRERDGARFAIADRITVLRDGEVVASRLAGDFSQPELVQAMVGRPAQAAWKI